MIFDKFVQSTGTNTGAGCTGPGLAICREIVDRHHGSIAACNEAGGGACFVFTVPASQQNTNGEEGHP